MTLELTSPDFASGERIPARFTCDGDDVSPHLIWSGAPPETRGFALLCDDPDAPGGVWHHWAVYDIPTDVSGLPEAYPAKGQIGEVRQAVNDFGRAGYGGPCPPRGNGIHHYRFRLFALTVESLVLPAGPPCAVVKSAAMARAIAMAELIGLCAR